jgi:hypothetical protein
VREHEHALGRDKGPGGRREGPIGVYALIQSFERGWGDLPGLTDMPVLGPGYMARNVDGIDANIEVYGRVGCMGLSQ